MTRPITGGCQCGAVRYQCENLGRASICHCRMCQKAFGGFFGPLVTGIGLRWMGKEPTQFQSSNKVKRGFCENCGTPLTYDYGSALEISIGSLDDPEQAAPVIQVNGEHRLSFVDGLASLPHRDLSLEPEATKFMQGIVSYQHPDEENK